MRLFSPLGSHSILVFPYQAVWLYSDRNPCNPDIQCRGGVKIVIFDQCLALSWKWYKSPSYYGKQIGNCTQGSNGTSFNDLKWPLTQSLRLQYYSVPNNLKMVQDRAILTMADQWKIVYGLSNGAIFLSRKSQFLTPLPCIQCPHYRGPCRNIVIISYRNHCHNIVILS